MMSELRSCVCMPIHVYMYMYNPIIWHACTCSPHTSLVQLLKLIHAVCVHVHIHGVKTVDSSFTHSLFLSLSPSLTPSLSLSLITVCVNMSVLSYLPLVIKGY